MQTPFSNRWIALQVLTERWHLQDALGKLVLKRLLLLVLLLDRAALSQHSASHDGVTQQHLRTPLLFCKQAPVKSSAQV